MMAKKKLQFAAISIESQPTRIMCVSALFSQLFAYHVNIDANSCVFTSSHHIIVLEFHKNEINKCFSLSKREQKPMFSWYFRIYLFFYCTGEVHKPDELNGSFAI